MKIYFSYRIEVFGSEFKNGISLLSTNYQSYDSESTLLNRIRAYNRYEEEILNPNPTAIYENKPAMNFYIEIMDYDEPRVIDKRVLIMFNMSLSDKIKYASEELQLYKDLRIYPGKTILVNQVEVIYPTFFKYENEIRID